MNNYICLFGTHALAGQVRKSAEQPLFVRLFVEAGLEVLDLGDHFVGHRREVT